MISSSSIIRSSQWKSPGRVGCVEGSSSAAACPSRRAHSNTRAKALSSLLISSRCRGCTKALARGGTHRLVDVADVLRHALHERKRGVRRREGGHHLARV